jgi:hypothetical protein
MNGRNAECAIRICPNQRLIIIDFPIQSCYYPYTLDSLDSLDSFDSLDDCS